MASTPAVPAVPNAPGVGPRERKDSEASLNRRDSTLLETIIQHSPFHRRRSTSGDVSDSGSALQSVLAKDEAARKVHNKLHKHKQSENSLNAGSDSDSDAGQSGASKPKRFNTLTRVLSSYRKRKPSDVGPGSQGGDAASRTGSIDSSTQTSPVASKTAAGGDTDNVVMSPVTEEHKEEGALDLNSPPQSPVGESGAKPTIVMTPPPADDSIADSGVLVHPDDAVSASTRMTPVSSAAAGSTRYRSDEQEGEWENVNEPGSLKARTSIVATDDGTLADESDSSYYNQPVRRGPAVVVKAKKIDEEDDGASVDVLAGDVDPSQRVPATPMIASYFRSSGADKGRVAYDEKTGAPVVEVDGAAAGSRASKMLPSGQTVETAAQYAFFLACVWVIARYI